MIIKDKFHTNNSYVIKSLRPSFGMDGCRGCLNFGK